MADGSSAFPASATMPAELLIWLSPAFPVGAFAFSHGLERLAEASAVRDRHTLGDWLDDLSSRGSLRNDLILLARAWRAARVADHAGLDDVAELAAAMCPTPERQLETLTQGGGFAAAILAAWDCASVRGLQERHRARIAYPVAVGAATADRGVALEATLQAFAVAFATNIVSAAIRLGVIGQFDGQRVLAAALPALRRAATLAATSTLADLGGAMFASDIASLEHETQYTRLFRS